MNKLPPEIQDRLLNFMDAPRASLFLKSYEDFQRRIDILNDRMKYLEKIFLAFHSYYFKRSLQDDADKVEVAMNIICGKYKAYILVMREHKIKFGRLRCATFRILSVQQSEDGETIIDPKVVEGDDFTEFSLLRMAIERHHMEMIAHKTAMFLFPLREPISTWDRKAIKTALDYCPECLIDEECEELFRNVLAAN